MIKAIAVDMDGTFLNSQSTFDRLLIDYCLKKSMLSCRQKTLNLSSPAAIQSISWLKNAFPKKQMAWLSLLKTGLS